MSKFFCSSLRMDLDKKCSCCKHEERQCENCWFAFKDEEVPEGHQFFECRVNPPLNENHVVCVEADQWCGKFYSKEMPPPWKPQLIHRLEPT